MTASLIINSPYIAPARHWQQARDGSLALVESRRPASYEIFEIRNNTRRTEELERIATYAKNDHLGFQLHYLWNGVRRRYLPDFLIRLASGKTLILEIKGEDSEQNRAKRAALAIWVQVVNAKGGFGLWSWDVAFQPAQIQDILARH